VNLSVLDIAGNCRHLLISDALLCILAAAWNFVALLFVALLSRSKETDLDLDLDF